MSPKFRDCDLPYPQKGSSHSYSISMEDQFGLESIELSDASIIRMGRNSFEPVPNDLLRSRRQTKKGRQMTHHRRSSKASVTSEASESSHKSISSGPSTSTTQPSSCSDLRFSTSSKMKKSKPERKFDPVIGKNDENDRSFSTSTIEKSPSLMNRISSYASAFSCTSSAYQESLVTDDVEIQPPIHHKKQQFIPKIRKQPYSRTLSNPKLIPKRKNSTVQKRPFRNISPAPSSSNPLQNQYNPHYEKNDSFDCIDLPSTIEIPPLHNIPYVHGGYAAVAPIMLQDSKWMNILRRLMPRSHREIVHKMYVGRTSDEPEFDFTPVKIMRWAENNPIVAAYGVLKGLQRKMPLQKKIRNVEANENARKNIGNKRMTLIQKMYQNSLHERSDSYHDRIGERSINDTENQNHSLPDPAKTPLEWDVFLDPTLVRKVDQAMQAVENQKKSNIEDSFAKTALEVEVDRRVTRLLERMLLAHGSVSQLAAEAIGMSPKLNFSRMTRSVPLSKPGKSVGGNGLFLPVWLNLFSAALKLGSKVDIILDDDSDDNSDVQTEIGTTLSINELEIIDRRLAHNSREKNILSDHVPEKMNASPNLVRSRFSSAPNTNSSQYYSNIQLRDSAVNKAPPLCGLFLCLGMDDPNSNNANTSCDMVSSLQSIYEVMNSNLKVILDLKSRRVPARVWGRLVDHIRARGISVEGIGSFDIPELRAVGSCCSSPLTQIIFFHSAGDLQRAVHSNEVECGDTVYFNAGSLLWQKPSLREATSVTCCGSSNFLDGQYMVKPFAQALSALREGDQLQICSTVEDYQRHLNLNIGVYVQEFSICHEALSAIIKLINKNSHVYNQGLAWGGLNGLSVGEIAGDGFWNQRFMGRNWDISTGPTDKLNLKPEDYKLVRDALKVDVWGQVGTANDVQGISDRIQAGACAPGVFVKIR